MQVWTTKHGRLSDVINESYNLTLVTKLKMINEKEERTNDMEETALAQLRFFKL